MTKAEIRISVPRHGFAAMVVLALWSGSVSAADVCAAAQGQPITFSVDVKAFGAIGDGTADDTAAIARAAACAAHLLEKPKIYAAELYFPAGVYAVSDRISVSAHVSAPVAGSLMVRGEGMMASRIVENGNAGILALNFANITTQVQVSQLSFFANAPGAGTALSITMPSKGLIQRRAVIVRDVTLGGIDIHRDYFDTGILLYATYRPLLENVLMTGPYGPGTEGAVRTGTCFDLRGSYSPTITDSACWSEGKGLEISGLEKGRLEGVFVTRSKFVNVDYGIIIDNADRMPEGMISENHINAHLAGLTLKGKKFVTIRDNLFYHQASGGSVPYNDILLEDTEKILVTGNIFHFPGDSNRIAIHIESSRDDTIATNMFNQPGTSILLGRGVLDTDILENRFFDQDLIKHVPLNEHGIIDHGVGTRLVPMPGAR